MKLTNREERILSFTPRMINPTNRVFRCKECNRETRKLTKLYRREPNEWDGMPLCSACWYSHQEDRDYIWRKLTGEYRKCEICYRDCIKNGKRVGLCHFDHKNIFTKKYNIFEMVEKGMDIELIKKEAEKCRLLCIECHDEFTEKQIDSGWVQVKSDYTRARNRREVNEDTGHILSLRYDEWYITTTAGFQLVLSLVYLLIYYPSNKTTIK